MSTEADDPRDVRPNRLLIKHVIRKIFLEDWLIKLVALAVTLALWLGVTGLSTPTTTRIGGIPLTLRFASNSEMTNSPVQEVDIVISGDKRRIDQINKNDLVMSVDLTDVLPGDRVIHLTPGNVNLELPTGVKLDEIQPNRIAVRLESVEEKDVEVKVETEGEIADGFEIYSAEPTPPKVRVRGPASFIRTLTSISTEKIAVAGRAEDFAARQVPLLLTNPKANPLDTAVDVAFRIGERRMERIFLVPVRDDGARRATVVLFGPRSLLLAAKASDLEVLIEPVPGGTPRPRLLLPAELQGKVEERKLSVP